MSNQESDLNEIFKKNHRLGIFGLFYIYNPIRSLIRSKIFVLSVLIALIFVLYKFKNQANQLEEIKKITSLGLSILPSIAGFNLAAYSLALTLILGNTKVLKSAIDLSNIFDKKERGTFYQKVNSTFAWSVLIQSASVLIFFIVELFQPVKVPFNLSTVTLLNSLILFIMALSASYSLLLVAQVVLNLFTFSQNMHSEVSVEALEDEIKEKEKEKERK